MAAALKAEYASNIEDLESSAKIVKFVVLKKHGEQEAAQEHELASFEETMLPHMDAAHNLAKWLLRNEQDAQDIVKRLTYVHLSLSVDFMAPTAGPGS